MEAVQELEARPDSAARRDVVVEEIHRSGADSDEDLIAEARELLAHIQADSALGPSVQQAIGSYIAQGRNWQSHAEVNVNKPKD